MLPRPESAGNRCWMKPSRVDRWTIESATHMAGDINPDDEYLQKLGTAGAIRLGNCESRRQDYRNRMNHCLRVMRFAVNVVRQHAIDHSRRHAVRATRRSDQQTVAARARSTSEIE